MAKILFWDLESTHLKSDFGTCLCIGWSWLDSHKVHCPKISDYKSFKKDATDDRGLIKDFREVLAEADIQVTYFGKGFDYPYLQGKCMEYRLGPMPLIPHVDLFFAVKSSFRITRKSLENTSRYLGLTAQKTPVLGSVWKRAMTGHEPSIHYIVKHCKADVELLKELYGVIRPLVKSHPITGHWEACAVCEGRLQRRGRAMSRLKGEQYRYQCQKCAAWSTRPLLIQGK